MSDIQGQLRRLALTYGQDLDPLVMPKLIVLFDSKGQVVPSEQVAEQFPGPETAGGLPTFTPTPGNGYYAHLRYAGQSIDALQGTNKTKWDVRGPDWSCEVHTFTDKNSGTMNVDANVVEMSPEGKEFPGRF